MIAGFPVQLLLVPVLQAGFVIRVIPVLQGVGLAGLQVERRNAALEAR